MMTIKKIGTAADHAGFQMKEAIKKVLVQLFPEVEIVDYGTYSDESVDYPDFAHKLGEAIDNGEVDYGLAVCGSGNGISMALNKHKKVRDALCWNVEIAELARLHNDANVLSLPGRFLTEKEGKEIVEKFFKTEFEGGRHKKRVDKI